MIEVKQTLLNFILFQNIDLWDTKRYTSASIESKYKIVGLGDCIREQSKKYKIFENADESFGILGVNNQSGIFDAYISKGKEINQPYKKMEVGWIAYNPYRINVGSIGVRKHYHNNEYISPAYVVFSCETTLLPEYLYLLFKSQTFNRIINESTTGSVRQNLSFDILKKLRIPLPSLEEQERIVNAYNEKIERAKRLEKEAEELEKEIDIFLLNSLEIKMSNVNKNNGLNIIQSSSFDRWGVDYLFKLNSLRFISEGKYEAKKVANILTSFQYGISEKAFVEPIGFPMLRMNNIYKSDLSVENLKYINTIAKENLSGLLLKKGDLLFNRTNSKELVGKTAVFDLDGDYLFASYLIRLKFDTNKVNVYYMNYLFNSSIGRTQIDMTSRQILGQANVNSKELQEFIFPIPPLDIQDLIVNELNNYKAKINSNKKRAEQLKVQASVEFEQEIFRE